MSGDPFGSLADSEATAAAWADEHPESRLRDTGGPRNVVGMPRPKSPFELASETWPKGSTIEHPILGPGVVRAADATKNRLYVEFSGNVQHFEPFVGTDDRARLRIVTGHDDEVDAAMRQMRIRAEARRRFEAEQAPIGEPFDAGTLEEIRARAPEPPMRADGLIPHDSSVLLVAQRKTGKTTFLLNWARAMICGGELLGQFRVRPIQGRVAILNFEVSAHTIAKWAVEVRIPVDRLVLVNSRGKRNPFTNADDRGRLAAFLRTMQVEAVAVDPFGRAYSGASQNDSGEVGHWLVALDTFVRTEVGATDLLLAAHAGWNGERTRGASALEDWADVIITMTRNDDDDRFLRAIGRDVEVDEDGLNFDPATRTLTLAGTGSRKDSALSKKAERLAVHVVAAVREYEHDRATDPEKYGPVGASQREIERRVAEFEDAGRYSAVDLRGAIKHAVAVNFLTTSPGPRRSLLHNLTDVAKAVP